MIITPEKSYTCSKLLKRFPVHNRQNLPRFGSDPFADQWELDRSQILIGPRLGGGQYGDVYKASFTHNNTTTTVAGMGDLV